MLRIPAKTSPIASEGRTEEKKFRVRLMQRDSIGSAEGNRAIGMPIEV